MPTAADRPPWPLLRLLIGRRSDDFRYAPNTAGLADEPVEIPACWFENPIPLRLERPYNHAEITPSGDEPVAISTNQDSVDTYNAVYPFTATLANGCTADPGVLASFTVTYNADPRMRATLLTINL